MAEYIEREAARTLIKNFGKGAISDGKRALDPVDDIILLASGVDLISAVDVIPKVAYEQVLWERDLALHQLKEHYGVGLGEKKADVVPVVYGRWKPEDNYFDGDTLGGRSEYYSQEDLNNDCITIYRRPPEGKKKK